MSAEEKLADRAAEEALVGSLLLSPSMIDNVDTLVAAEDFHWPDTRLTYGALVGMRGDGEAIDVVTVADRLGRAGQLDAIGGPATLITLETTAPAVASAPRYARIVAEFASLRRFRRFGEEVAQRSSDRPSDPLEVPAWARGELDRLEARVGSAWAPSKSARELADEPDEEEDWLIEDWLRRGDVMMLTAQSGSGKSLWLQQVAVQCASGVHPMRVGRMAPLKVLICDFENGKRRFKRRLHRLTHHEGAFGFNPDRLMTQIIDGGVDLSTDIGAAWLRTVVRADRPDLLIIGPWKNMHMGEERPGNDGGERLARKVTHAIDRVREEFGCAVLIEAHGGHEETGSDDPYDYRPRGSKFLVNWPPIGACLYEDEDAAGPNRVFHMGFWRELRDEDIRMPRRWMRGGPRWPWVPCDPVSRSGYFPDPD